MLLSIEYLARAVSRETPRVSRERRDDSHDYDLRR